MTSTIRGVPNPNGSQLLRNPHATSDRLAPRVNVLIRDLMDNLQG